MQSTRGKLLTTGFPTIFRTDVQTLQVNLGYTCNLSCSHCHVNAGPSRTEQMDRDSVEKVLQVLQVKGIQSLDLTGGAPEMNPHFTYLVHAARELGVEVIDRCNLTILREPDYDWLAPFLASEAVVVVASLPCYSEANVASQRGKGVFEASIAALHDLNALGYGMGDLPLHLVYNPTGPFLPPAQESLEHDYKRELLLQYGIHFDRLFTLANMPISRFGAVLLASGEFDHYMDLLKQNFKSDNLETLMCKRMISVDWQGLLYDCDFNQMLSLPIEGRCLGSTQLRQPLKLDDLLTGEFMGRTIRVGEHCYGCAAGQGSSCGGALKDEA